MNFLYFFHIFLSILIPFYFHLSHFSYIYFKPNKPMFCLSFPSLLLTALHIIFNATHTNSIFFSSIHHNQHSTQFHIHQYLLKKKKPRMIICAALLFLFHIHKQTNFFEDEIKKYRYPTNHYAMSGS